MIGKTQITKFLRTKRHRGRFVIIFAALAIQITLCFSGNSKSVLFFDIMIFGSALLLYVCMKITFWIEMGDDE